MKTIVSEHKAPEIDGLVKLVKQQIENLPPKWKSVFTMGNGAVIFPFTFWLKSIFLDIYKNECIVIISSVIKMWFYNHTPIVRIFVF